jgi:GWxTD domain-containing protein
MTTKPSIFLLAATLFWVGMAACTPKILPNEPNRQQVSASRATATQGGGQVKVAGGKIDCKHRVVDNQGHIRVMLQLELTRLANDKDVKRLIEEFNISYGIISDYDERQFVQTGVLQITEANARKTGQYFYVMADIPKREDRNEAVLLIEIFDKLSTQKGLYNLPVRFQKPELEDIFYWEDADSGEVQFQSYFRTQNRLKIRALHNNAPNVLTVTYYQQPFGPAAIPMATQVPMERLPALADSTFSIRTGQPLSFAKPGFYLIDNAAYTGVISVYIAENRFPKLAQLQDLVQPLRYITTEEEFQRLQVSADTKEALDSLWLELMDNNLARAKATIKAYYQRVKFANEFFTDYKPGWQTDMGMIFTVFGSPQKVKKFNDKEIWTYTQGKTFSETNFTFQKTRTVFGREVFVLVRYPEYEQVWYEAIERWREGRVGS